MSYFSDQEIKKKFGQNLKKLRTAKNLSQEELAFQVGLHRTYIGSVERGERNISLINIVKIAKTLQIPISQLFEELEK